MKLKAEAKYLELDVIPLDIFIGINPREMRGSSTAVFCGAYGGDAADYNLYRLNRDHAGYAQLSFANFMIPGRIAFNFDLQGPSAHTCSACSSSLTALEAAVSSIVLGKCDAAIVTGSTIHLNPQSHLDLMATNVLAPDGRCKTFDETGLCEQQAYLIPLLIFGLGFCS